MVSGGARGVDAAGHGGCLAEGGRTVAVLGTAVNRVYPSEHRELFRRIAERGALVSEYPMDTGGDPWRFPERNRLIVGPPAMAGGAVTGAMSMALHAASRAPHGGVFVFFAMDNFAWFVISILVGAVISCAGIVALKQMAATKKAVEEDAAKAAPVAA